MDTQKRDVETSEEKLFALDEKWDDLASMPLEPSC